MILKKDTLIIEFVEHDGVRQGRYFLTADLLDHRFEGDSTLFTANYKGQYSLTCVPFGEEWKMEYQSRSTKRSRKRVKLNRIPLKVLNEEATSYAKEKSQRFRYYPTTSNDSLTVYKEAHTGIRLFRVKGNATNVNERLQAMHENLCLTYSSLRETESVTVDFQLFSLTGHTISFALSYTQNWGGAHGNTYTEYFNWHPKTAKTVRLEGLFYWGSGPIPTYQSQAWFHYRHNLFAQRLRAVLPLERSCLNKERFWQFPKWYITGDTIVFLPFSSELTTCDQKHAFSVPLDLLR